MTQFSQKKHWDGVTLADYVESLLRLGKRRDAPEFQSLIQIYGLEKILELVKRVYGEIRIKDGNGSDL